MTHAEAAAIVRVAWPRVWSRPPAYNELLFTLAVASFETGYGRVDQHGKLAAQGFYNWGNIEKPRLAGGGCPDGWAPGVDQGPVCFQVWPTDEGAAAGYITTLTKRRPSVLAAMAIGTPEAVARAMKETRYYAGPESGYAAGLRAKALEIRPALGGIDSPAVPLVAMALVAAGVVYVARGRLSGA